MKENTRNEFNNNIPKELKIYSISEVAKILRTSPNNIYKFIDIGLLKCIVIGSKKVTYNSLKAFLEKFDGSSVLEEVG